MTMRSITIIAGIILLGVIPLAVSGSRLHGARQEGSAARIRLTNLTRDAETILNLRTRRQNITLHKRPPREVIPLINSLLDGAGLPRTRLSNLSPRSSGTSVPAGVGRGESSGGGLHRQSMTLILSNISIVDLGAFLGAWRAADHLWTITRLELIHQRNPRGPQNLFAITLHLDALYAEES